MNLKRLVEISPLIGSFLVFLGFLKLHYYYGHWNIEIINYLDFSEIILSFLNDLNVLIVFVALIFFQAILGHATINKIDNHFSNKKAEKPILPNLQSDSELSSSTQQIEKKSRIMSRVDDVFVNHLGKLLIATLLFTLFFFALFLYFISLVWLYLTIGALVQFIALVFDVIFRIEARKISLQLSFIITLFCFTVGIGWFEIKQTEQNSRKIEIVMDKETFSTNTNILFLGKTNNFYLFYDNAQKKSIVFNSSLVQKIIQIP